MAGADMGGRRSVISGNTGHVSGADAGVGGDHPAVAIVGGGYHDRDICHQCNTVMTPPGGSALRKVPLFYIVIM